MAISAPVITAHTLSIAGQLQAGVRGLLIDAHYGLQVGNAVRTDLSERSEQAGNEDRELYLETLGPEGFAAIQRVGRPRKAARDGPGGRTNATGQRRKRASFRRSRHLASTGSISRAPKPSSFSIWSATMSTSCWRICTCQA